MRVLHTSDWHLGKRLLERSLLEDQEHALAGLRSLLVREHHDLLVIAGDLFDLRVPPEEAVALWTRFLVALREEQPQLPIVVIAGNHDSATRVSVNADLLRARGVYIQGDVRTLDVPVQLTTASGEHVEVWALPFLWPGAIARDDVVARTQQEAFTFAIERIRSRQDRARTQVLVAHCFAQGGSSSESERPFLGQASLIPSSLFEGFDYVALGHLHRPQQVTSHAHYSGSLLPYSFSEIDHDKAVLSVDVQAGVAPVVQRHALPQRRRFRRIEGTLHELLTSSSYAPFVDDYLAVALTQPEEAGQPMAMLRTRFPHVLHLHNPIAAFTSLLSASEHGTSAPSDADAPPRPGDDLNEDCRAFLARVSGGEDDDALLAAFQSLRTRIEKEAP